MTIDERLQALRESLELQQLSQRDTSDKIRAVAALSEQNKIRAAEMMEVCARLNQPTPLP